MSERYSREEYRDVYLDSDHWRWMRRQALTRAEHRCQVCNESTGLDVHHRTYERLGEERLADLTVLCRKCHELFHEGGRLARPGPAPPRPDELSQRSLDWVRQAVPEPQVMWLRAREHLKTAPWSTAADVAAAVPVVDGRTYDDWAYRILARACLDGFVQRRNVPEGKRYRVQWALAAPLPEPKAPKKQRRKAAAKKRKAKKGDLARDLAAMKQRNAARGREAA